MVLIKNLKKEKEKIISITYQMIWCRLDWAFAFTNALFFFFFFKPYLFTFRDKIHCLWTVHVLFMYCACTVHVFKNIKNESHSTIHLNYFATVFSVFSFSNNKFNLNGPIVLLIFNKIPDAKTRLCCMMVFEHFASLIT